MTVAEFSFFKDYNSLVNVQVCNSLYFSLLLLFQQLKIGVSLVVKLAVVAAVDLTLSSSSSR